MVFYLFVYLFSRNCSDFVLGNCLQLWFISFLDKVVLAIGCMICTVSTVGLRELSNPEF